MKIEDFLSNDAFTMVNKKLAKTIWIWQAIYLQELISQRKRFWMNEFYFTQNNMEDELWISTKTQQRYAKELKEKWLINIEKKGIPARNYYTIIDGAILNLLPDGKTSAVNLTELEKSKWPDYSNKKENNKENINSEPKPESVTPTLGNGDLTFEKIYNLFYHKSWHKPSLEKCKKVFDVLNLDAEWYEMLVKDLKLFKMEYKYWVKDQKYRPWFEKYVWGFNAEWVNEEYRLKEIVKHHMMNSEDIEKWKKRYKDLCETLWKDVIDKLVKEYGKNKNKITLKAD